MQNSVFRASIGCLSQFVKPFFVRGPHTALPYSAIGSITDLKIFSQIVIGISNLIDFLIAETAPRFFPELLHSQVKTSCGNNSNAQISVCFRSFDVGVVNCVNIIPFIFRPLLKNYYFGFLMVYFQSPIFTEVVQDF